MNSNSADLSHLAAAARGADDHKILDLCELLLSAETETEMLRGLMRILTESWGADIAWVGRPDANGNLNPDECAGPGAAEYMRLAKIGVVGDSVPQGPAARCWKSKTTVIVADWLLEPVMAPWQKLEFGWRCSVSVPLLGVRGMEGVLSLYSRQPEFFFRHAGHADGVGPAIGQSP